MRWLPQLAASQRMRMHPSLQGVRVLTQSSVLPERVASDPWPVFAILAASAAASRSLDTTKIGRTLSAPICAMAITFAMTATGVLPCATQTVSDAQSLAIQLATPLLLLNADLRAVGRRAGRLVPAFLLGTLGTLMGSIIGILLLRAPLCSAFGADGLKVAAALAAKNIGGGLNFVAVASALDVSPVAFASALAVDNVMALIYFPLVAMLGRGTPDVALEGSLPALGAHSEEVACPGEVLSAHEAGDLPRQDIALAVSLAIVAVSRRLAASFLPGFDLPIATILAAAAATLVPGALTSAVPAATELGNTFIFLFFATAGWTGGSVSMSMLLAGGPVLLAFLAMLYAVHLAVVLGLGNLLRHLLPRARRVERCTQLPSLLVASNANIGGPATASALATGNRWPSLVTPALLVGNAGYAIATPLAVVLYEVLKPYMRLI